MRLGRTKSPDEITESNFSENISLVACPFLGLNEDPGTSLGYAHAANQCHRLIKPAGIDLTHQYNYCLGENYTRCYVYAQSRPRSKSVKKTFKQPSPMPDDSQPESTGFSPKKRGLRILGLLVMLFLIGIAAIIWWPPPGISLEDVIVRGSSITKEVTESEATAPDVNSQGEIDEGVLAQPAISVETSTGLVGESMESDSSGQAASSGTAKSNKAVDEQEKAPALSLTSSEGDIPRPGEGFVAGEDGEVDGSEFDNPVEDYAMVVSEAADAGDDLIGEENEIDEAAAPESDLQTAATEQPEQVETTNSSRQDGAENSSTEATISDTAPVEQETSSAPAAAKTAYIGPLTNTTGLQESSESPPLLYLLRRPGDGANVLAMIPERQAVTVLGRNSSGEWLLVRLGSGVEGWVHATESGASIIVSNLPVMDDVSGKVPASPSGEEPVEPVEEKQESSPKVGQSPMFGTAIIKTGALNLRSGPGLEYESVGVGYNGQQVSLLEQFGSRVWIQVRLPNGTQGWVNSTYLAQTG